MKRVQRFFERSNVSNPPNECGSSASVSRPSFARCRLTERHSQPESEEVPRTWASSYFPFANYKRVVDDDDKHVSKMKRTPEWGLFYIRSTWHIASRIYNTLSHSLEVQMLLRIHDCVLYLNNTCQIPIVRLSKCVVDIGGIPPIYSASQHAS